MTNREREILGLKARLKRWGPEEIEAGLREFEHRRNAHGRLARAIAQIQSRLGLWGPREVALGLDEFRVRTREHQRRRRSFTVTAALAASLVAAILLVSVRRVRRDVAPSQPLASLEPAKNGDSEARNVLSLDEGSDVTLLGDESEATVTERRADRISVDLRSGRARFRVKHSTDRMVAVLVGGVRIEDLGTTFVVERRADQALVSVSEGSVRVSWDGQTAELAAGGHGAYPVVGDADLRGIPSPEASSPKRVPSGESWRTAARDGRYDRAWSLLSLEGPETVKDDPTDLLLAADVARLSGHPAEAVGSLRAVVRKHRRDPRAQSAAFTLGLVLMKNLGRPGEAAQAFADVERLAPSGNLAEDAVAREAEAWLMAGERERAETERNRYASTYPHGRHLTFLRHIFDAR